MSGLQPVPRTRKPGSCSTALFASRQFPAYDFNLNPGDFIYELAFNEQLRPSVAAKVTAETMPVLEWEEIMEAQPDPVTLLV